MTLDEMRTAVADATAKGHDWIQITIRRKKSPANWDRVRIMTGVVGRCIGEVEPGRYLVDVPLDRLRAALAIDAHMRRPTQAKETKR